MTSRKFSALIVLLALAAFAIGCGDNANNGNNANNNNANHANANTNINTNTNVANANTNANKAPTREDVEKNKEKYGQEAKSGGRKVGSGANDTWLWVKTRYDLAAADDLRDSTINVDVDNGVVTLTGDVASQAQVTKADSVAKAVEGVKSVRNQLKVSAGGGNKNANAGAANKNANAGAAKH